MRPLLLVIAAFGTLPIPAAQAKGDADEIRYVDDVGPLNIRPTYEHGFLAVYDQMTKVYSPDGTLLFSSRPSKGTVTNVAIDADGTVALAIWESEPSRGSISVLNREGVQTRLIQTSKYIPSGVCFAADHTLWVIGAPGSEGTGMEGDDYFLLRHYSRDSAELGQHLPRSSFPPGGNPVPVNVGLWRIRTSNERVGVFLDGWRREQETPLWVETTLAGQEVGRWRLNTDAFPTAFTPGGVVYAESNNGPLVLDRLSGQWTATTSSNSGKLIGADAHRLVYLNSRLSIVKTPSE